MADMLRTMKFTVADDSEGAWRTEVDSMLQAVAWALRSTVNSTTKMTPANLLFNKDMVLNKEIDVNWLTIKEQREKQALVDNKRENAGRKEHTYSVGSKCWIVRNKFERARKLDKVAEGPFEILRVHNNGTVKIDRGGYDEVIHMRRLKPYQA